MTGLFKTLLAAGATTMLAACACPNVSGDYERVPYDERTAGSGIAVYDGKCKARPMAKPVKYESREPIREAEPVMRERMRK
jgi:hypothetical protein